MDETAQNGQTSPASIPVQFLCRHCKQDMATHVLLMQFPGAGIVPLIPAKCPHCGALQATVGTGIMRPRIVRPGGAP